MTQARHRVFLAVPVLSALPVPAATVLPTEIGDDTRAGERASGDGWLDECDIQTALAFVRQARAESTLRIYAADMRVFATWCAARNLTTIPAPAATVSAFLAGEARAGRRPATVERRAAAIRHAHCAAGHPSPTDDALVRATLAGIRRSLGVAARKKAPVTVERLRDMLAQVGDDFRGSRDRALLLLGFAGAFRRSELAALRVEDLEETAHGLLVYIRRSKTDQEGRGRQVAIPYGRDHCPVRALRRWLARAGILSGPIFRGIDRGGRLDDRALNDRTIARTVKRYATAAGLAAEDFAGHSLRRGFLTSAAQRGAKLFKLKEVSGHRSLDMVQEYIESVDLFEDHAGQGLL